MTPEQRIARQQKEAEADIRRAILGQETFEIKALDEGDAHSIVADKTKFTRDIAVASWMDGINGKDNIPGTMDWQANKDALAQEYFKQDVRGISDDDFAGLVRDHITAQSAFADVAFTAAAKETPLPEAIKEARKKSGLFGIGHKFAANEGRYLADFTRQYADTKEKLFPYREQINQLTEMGRGAEERIAAGEGSPWEDMAKVMLTIPAEDREDVLHAIAAQDKKEGETEKDAFTRTVLAFDRGLERYVMTAGEGMRDIGFTALMAGAAAESAEARRFGAPAEMPKSFIRPEEEQQMDFLKRQMRDLSRGSLDPLDRVELLGMSISGAAENLPMMAASFIPYVGPAMMLGSFKAETEYQLRQQYPEMDSATIEGFSMFAAPFQAASEVIGNRLLFGRLPNLGRFINSPAFKSGAIVGQLAGRVGIGGTIEYTEELFQQAFPQVMVDLAEAMGADIPDVNWGDFWRDWKANQGELIATIIPLVLLGSGVGQFSDFQNSRALARDQDLLVAAGYSVENAAKIKEFADAGKWGEAQDLMLKDWRAVNAKGVSIPEVSNEAATKILAEREAAKEKVLEKLQQVQDDVGRIAAQGGYSLSKVAGGWQVTTPDSQVTVASAEEATALLQNHYNEAERENILAVAKLADELEKQGDTQRVEIKPGEQVQITWEDNQQAVEVAARMAGLTPEQAKRVTFSVLGSNRFEHAEGLKRAVSTIFQGGNVLTMVEETVEGRFKRALDTGALTKEEATKMVQLAESIVNEGKTGADRQTIFDTQAADQDRALIEAVSKIVYLDVFGRRKEGGRFTPGLISRGLKAAVQMQAPTEALAFQMQQAAQGKTAEASQMHAFLSAFRTLFGSVFKAARALKQARAQGKTEELDTFINKLIGVQAEVVEQEATFQEAQTLLAEMPQLEGQPYETFSMRAGTVSAEQLESPNRFFRVIVGDEAFQDIVTSGEVRTNAATKGGTSLMEKLALRPTAFPSFSKGAIAMSYAAANPNHYVIATESSLMQPSTLGRHGAGTTHFPTDAATGQPLKAMPAGEVQVYKHIGNGRYALAYDQGVLVAQPYETFAMRVLMTRKALTDAALQQESWRDWYEEHQAVLDDFFGEYAPLFQDILSITSQAASVKANVGLALKAFGLYVRGESFDARERGEEKPGFLPAVIMNLNRLREDKQIQGQKIKAYKASNEGAVDQAVIDRHITRLLFGVDTPSAKQFAKAQRVLSEIADDIGWTPRQVQAALWAHSIYKSGKTPESYGAYLTKLEAKGTIAKRIGDLAGRGAGFDAAGRGRGRFAPLGAGKAEVPGVTFSMRPQAKLDSYKDRAGYQAGESFTETEIREGIEDESGTVADIEIDDDAFSSEVDTTFSIAVSAPLITRASLKGKKKFVYFSDWTRVGTYTGLHDGSGISIPLQGGPLYPYIGKNAKAGAGWAFTAEGMFTRFQKRVDATDGIGLTTLYGKDNLRANPTFLAAYVEELRYAVRAGLIKEGDMLSSLNQARIQVLGLSQKRTDRETGTVKVKFTVSRDSEAFALFSEEWKSIEDFQSAMSSATFEVRAAMFSTSPKEVTRDKVKTRVPGQFSGGRLASQKNVNAGMPDVIKMIDLFADPRFDGGEYGTIIGAVQFEKSQSASTKAEDIGAEIHLSYPVVIKGTGIGLFSDPIHVTSIIKKAGKKASEITRSAEVSMADATFSMRPSFEDRLTGVFSPLMRDPVVRRELAQRALEKAKSAATKLGKLKKGEVTPQEQRDRTVAGLRVLNAALAAMPPVVRTRVGGFIAVAQRTTAEGMMREIERRIAKLDVELERYLAEEATQEAEDLFDRYKSQRDSGGRQAGKIMASATEQIDYALGIYDLDDDQQDTTIGGLQKRIDDADNADDLADAMNKLAIAELFSHWEKQDSESRYAAVDWMRDIIETGKLGRSIIDEERKQFLAALKEDARTSVLGDVRASLAEAENKDNQTDSSAWQTFVRNVKSAGGSLLWTTAQQIELLFGADSQVYKYFTDKIVEAANLSTDIKTAADKRRVAFMQQLFDTKSSLKLAQAMARLQKARSSGVFVNVGRVVEKVKIPVEVLERLSDGTVTPEDIGLNDAQAQQALEDFAAAGPMKRQIEVEKVVNAGEQVEKFMSEGQGIMWFLWSRQDVSRKQMERDGWNEDSLKQLDAFLSDEAKAIADFIAQDLQMAGDMIDPVYRRLFNAPMPRNKNYAPIYRLKPADTAAMDFEAGMSSGLDAGFTKARVNNSLPLREMDAFVVFLSHWEHVSHWVSHAELMRDMKSVMFDANVQNAIRTKSGKGALEGINNRLKAIESNGNRAAWDLHSVNKIWSNLTKFRAFKGLAFRVSPVVKQTSAFLNPLLADVPAHAYAIGLANAFGDPVNFSSDVAAMWESPIIQRRLDGGFSAEARIAMGRAGITGSTLVAAMQKGMMPMAMTDAGWTALGAAISFRYYKKVAMREEGTTEEQANAIAMKRVERMIATSAQPADLVNRALIENQTNPIVKSLWMFASESRKSLAIELMAMRNLAKGKEVGMNIQRILVAHFVQAAVTQLMGSFLMSIMGDDDDKERAWSLDTWALSLALGPINGLFVLGSVIDTAARRAAGMYTFPSELLPGQVYSVTEKAVRNIDDLFQDDPDSVLDEIDKISAAVGTIMSTIFGPAGGAVDVFGNVARDARKIYKSQTED
jgi:hypothetical protein